MEETISIEQAASLWLLGFKDKSAFFDSELYSFLYTIRETKTFQNQAIKGLRKDSNLKRKFTEISKYLLTKGLVEKNNEKYFTIGAKIPDSLEIVCSLYSDGYVSYLSAMRFYNLTNRLPKRIDYTAPNRQLWKKIQARSLTENNITDANLGTHVFTTPYPSEKIRIKNKYLNVHSRSCLYPYKLKGKNIRIIDIGDLFLEMLRHPDLCGGFQHVLEIYEEMAEVMLDEIVLSAVKYGTAIDKCRLGFIIDSYLGINDDRVLKWKVTSPSRGGSRKMIPNAPYADNYDESWCISLNHIVFDSL